MENADGHVLWGIWDRRCGSLNIHDDKWVGTGPFPHEAMEIGKGVPFLVDYQDPNFKPWPSSALAPTPQGPGHPGAALTGDIELDGCLHSHTRCRKMHLTGEVGAMVLGPWDEGEHGR